MVAGDAVEEGNHSVSTEHSVRTTCPGVGSVCQAQLDRHLSVIEPGAWTLVES